MPSPTDPGEAGKVACGGDAFECCVEPDCSHSIEEHLALVPGRPEWLCRFCVKSTANGGKCGPITEGEES